MSFGWWRIHFNCFFSNRFCKCQATTVATSRKMKMGLFENKLPVIILFPVKNFKHHLGGIHHFQTDLNWFEDILKLNQHDPSPWFMSSLPLGPDCTRKQESNSEWIESLPVEPPWIAQSIGVSINISVFFAGVSYWLFSLLKSGHGAMGQTKNVLFNCSGIGNWHRVLGTLLTFPCNSTECHCG